MAWSEIDDPLYRESDSGYELLTALQGVLPLIRYDYVVISYSVRKFSVVERNILNYISSFPCSSIEDIAGFFALQPMMVSELIDNYADSNDLVHDHEVQYLISDDLQQQIKQDEFRIYQREKRIIYYCGVDRGWLQINDDFDFFLEEGTRDVITPNDEVLIKLESDSSTRKLNRIDSGVAISLSLNVEVLILGKLQDKELGWELYCGEKKMPYLKSLAMEYALFEAIERVMDCPTSETDEFPEPEATSQLEFNDEVRERIKNLNTLDARKELIRIISSAKDEIILWYPWINSHAVNINGDLFRCMREAVNRGVRLYIFYGIDTDKNKETSRLDVINKLQNLGSNRDNPAVVLWLGHAHVKKAMIDRRWNLSGSHNLLSFKANERDRQQDIRIEETVLYDDITSLNESFMVTIQPHLRRQVSSEHISSLRHEERSQLFMLDPDGWQHYYDWNLPGIEVAQSIIKTIDLLGKQNGKLYTDALIQLLTEFFGRFGECKSFVDNDNFKRSFFSTCNGVNCPELSTLVSEWEALISGEICEGNNADSELC